MAPTDPAFYIDYSSPPEYMSHMVIRGTFVPDTVRCMVKYTESIPSSDGSTFQRSRIVCFSDIRVNEYIVGAGPDDLTVMLQDLGFTPRLDELPGWVDWTERMYVEGGSGPRFGQRVSDGGIEGREVVMFAGPSPTAYIQAMRVYRFWNVEHHGEASVRIVHPNRDEYSGLPVADRPKLEWTLAEFTSAATTAHETRVAKYGGRIAAGVNQPMIVTDVANLSTYYEGGGLHDDPDVSVTMPPPPCGLAVPNQASNPGLMLDCFALLDAKDELRGTGTLNWSVDVAIGSWDGVTVAGTPLRVTKLELANRSLTGSIPAGLARLNLTALKLAGNSLTGCIPVGLQDVPTNDLDDLGLPDCTE